MWIVFVLSYYIVSFLERRCPFFNAFYGIGVCATIVSPLQMTESCQFIYKLLLSQFDFFFFFYCANKYIFFLYFTPFFFCVILVSPRFFFFFVCLTLYINKIGIILTKHYYTSSCAYSGFHLLKNIPSVFFLLLSLF